MDLKTKVDSYVGGQMEIQNQVEEYLYRGEIERIAVEDNELRVRFAWVAKGEGYPQLKKWIKDDGLDYAVSLEICRVSDIGDGRICLRSPITHELAVLFPKDGSKLDPSTVEGLDAKVK